MHEISSRFRRHLSFPALADRSAVPHRPPSPGWSRSGRHCVALATFLVLLTGCDPMPPPPMVSQAFRPITQGTIGTRQVVITAEDNSFAISADQDVWKTPFQSDCWCSDMGAAWPPETKLIDAYRIALRHGGRLVRVQVPWRPKPLYGILMLCPAHPNATGPASRTYRIELDPTYVNRATAGLMSTMYELMNYSQSTTQQLRWYSWILWLSEEPIPMQ